LRLISIGLDSSTDEIKCGKNSLTKISVVFQTQYFAQYLSNTCQLALLLAHWSATFQLAEPQRIKLLENDFQKSQKIVCVIINQPFREDVHCKIDNLDWKD
jgi:hypothetical protein